MYFQQQLRPSFLQTGSKADETLGVLQHKGTQLRLWGRHSSLFPSPGFKYPRQILSKVHCIRGIKYFSIYLKPLCLQKHLQKSFLFLTNLSAPLHMMCEMHFFQENKMRLEGIKMVSIYEQVWHLA